MNEATLRQLLAELVSGTKSVEEVLSSLRHFPSEDLGFATIDHHRTLRQGRPEVIYAEGKTVDQVTTIAERLVDSGNGFLATRTSEAQRKALASVDDEVVTDSLGRTAWLPSKGALATTGQQYNTLIVAAGTSDLSVAREAANTLTAWGRPSELLVDVGVAGIHRLLSESGRLHSADVIIVIAGMEGALASVVGGMVAGPVIAVPTSIGYGASFGGMAALLAMLNSCAAGVTVTNIDNGFGAAVAADRILQHYDRED